MSSSSSPCPLDAEFSDQIAALLAPPSPQSEQEYYDELIEKTKCDGIRVKRTKKIGKGVFANKEFKEGELILKDQILFAAQHSSNKVDCLVCSRCFCFIGSVELQIGRKLYFQNTGLSRKQDCDHDTISSTSEEDFPTELLDEGEGFITDHSNGVGSSTSQKLKENSLSEEILESLMNGDLSLPHSKNFLLPPVVACPGGCEEEHYCSQQCADSDWGLFHSLLCNGNGVESTQRDALLRFIDHANRTNDIFILAAKAISFVILKYRKLKQHIENSKDKVYQEVTDGSCFPLLFDAWKSISMGFKGRWWDCISLPDEVSFSNEASFRMQIRDLAFTSLQLLKDAIFNKECAPLFSLEIYGTIIGMFELNNLDLVVASPVEDYFIYIDDLPFPEKEEAEKVTKRFLNALGEEYSVCCQGTGFYPLQSCMNHSCCPNAQAFKRDEDKDGQAVILATRSISLEEEITISYIDEDVPFEERQALLADYGFRCKCQKCLDEQP
ncbi:uncharacterized protein A4U43_C08F26140 [Asparagus officinalis]|uniref:histone-lysine N-methyltransferase ATXR2 n=1 Tax=Asparagus officinalis TaxID=4686 RepID=UPI00098E42F9|nr:histone-lysine N-methyltransferase ATXR2 [Asparagus officinalis]ONK61089.1 uncharacterized protein A4U43_C08F26140 [Asparagus officinalis]